MIDDDRDARSRHRETTTSRSTPTTRRARDFVRYPLSGRVSLARRRARACAVARARNGRFLSHANPSTHTTSVMGVYTTEYVHSRPLAPSTVKRHPSIPRVDTSRASSCDPSRARSSASPNDARYFLISRATSPRVRTVRRDGRARRSMDARARGVTTPPRFARLRARCPTTSVSGSTRTGF